MQIDILNPDWHSAMMQELVRSNMVWMGFYYYKGYRMQQLWIDPCVMLWMGPMEGEMS